MTDNFVHQITLAGKTVGLPAMPTATAAEALADLILSDAPMDADWVTAAQHLACWGWRFVWNPHNDTYSLIAGGATWAAARCNEAREGRPFFAAGCKT